VSKADYDATEDRIQRQVANFDVAQKVAKAELKRLFVCESAAGTDEFCVCARNFIADISNSVADVPPPSPHLHLQAA
jgi:hypothetical protein